MRRNHDETSYIFLSLRRFVGEITAFHLVHPPRKIWALRRQTLAAIILGLTVVVTTAALENKFPTNDRVKRKSENFLLLHSDRGLKRVGTVSDSVKFVIPESKLKKSSVPIQRLSKPLQLVVCCCRGQKLLFRAPRIKSKLLKCLFKRNNFKHFLRLYVFVSFHKKHKISVNFSHNIYNKKRTKQQRKSAFEKFLHSARRKHLIFNLVFAWKERKFLIFPFWIFGIQKLPQRGDRRFVSSPPLTDCLLKIKSIKKSKRVVIECLKTEKQKRTEKHIKNK